jgi:HK97 family phage major capsid protein
MQNHKASERADVRDERLRALAVSGDDDNGSLAFVMPGAFGPSRLQATAGSDEQGNYSDTYGGFSVRSSLGPPRQMIGFEGDPTEGRCEVIPMATPTVEMEAATDKNHTTSVSGGLTVSRKAEAASASSSRQAMEMVTLKATSTFGLSYVTEELLADSPISWLTRIANGFNGEFAAFKFKEKLRGLGGNERLGVLTALSASTMGPTISIAKESSQAADTFLYNNVLKMRSRCWGYGNAIWLANHDCYPQLAVLSIPVGVAGALVYQQSLVEDRPDMMLGRPIFYTEYASTVGDQGDLILGNWSQYMEGEYQPIQSAESIHVRFVQHERSMKFWKRDCGAPSWRVPLTPNKSSNTLSPFVTLDAR